MPPKHSRGKKKSPAKKGANKDHSSHSESHLLHDHENPSPLADQSLSQPTVAQLENIVSRILLIRYKQDIVRLFSTHIYYITLSHIPTFVLRCITVGGPSWVAANAGCDEIKDFFRGALAMELRQAGDYVATKSLLWTYKALRHFAKSNGILICERRGLHSWQLLPYYSGLRVHLEWLEAQPAPRFTKPSLLGPPTAALDTLATAARDSNRADDADWCARVREGYERACGTLWAVAQEFDVRGYGLVLRHKLTETWCKCGCSTDHLGEVCEPSLRAEEVESGVRAGKEREWDGRGAGVHGWGTEEEEDLWTVANDQDPDDDEMSVVEFAVWRYMCSEQEKDRGNIAFKNGEYEHAIKHYENAYRIEPELPHYQLNLAAAYLKISNFVEAGRACDIALGQHRSVKGHWRRAQSRKAQGQVEDALEDLREVLRLQPSNAEALAEIKALCSTERPAAEEPTAPSSSSSAAPSPSTRTSTERPAAEEPTAPSSSSSAAPSPSTRTSTASSSYSSWIPTPEPPPPLPFARIKTDDRKLKICVLPITVDIPADYPEVAAAGGMCMSKLPGSCTSGLGPGPTGKNTYQYPSFEQYMVRRMSD